MKWAVALLGLIVLYAVVQPTLNSRLGWKLPSLARLMGEPEPKIKPDDNPEPKVESKKRNTKLATNAGEHESSVDSTPGDPPSGETDSNVVSDANDAKPETVDNSAVEKARNRLRQSRRSLKRQAQHLLLPAMENSCMAS